MKIDEIRNDKGELPAFAWPGGYPILYFAKDNGILCAKCANAYTADRDNEEQLMPVAYDVYYEGPTEHCEHCNAEIESAYGDPDAEPKLLTWYDGMGRLTLEMTLEQAESVSHQGQCDEDVIELMKVPHIAKQLDAMEDADIVASLREVGAWEPSEMLNRETNLQRIVWIAGCDLKEEARSKE